jgi:hypothetical protein
MVMDMPPGLRSPGADKAKHDRRDGNDETQRASGAPAALLVDVFHCNPQFPQIACYQR